MSETLCLARVLELLSTIREFCGVLAQHSDFRSKYDQHTGFIHVKYDNNNNLSILLNREDSIALVEENHPYESYNKRN